MMIRLLQTDEAEHATVVLDTGSSSRVDRVSSRRQWRQNRPRRPVSARRTWHGGPDAYGVPLARSDNHALYIGTPASSWASASLFELEPLDGAPWSSADTQQVYARSDGLADNEQITIEYRLRAGLDQGLPDPSRWVVFHATERTQPRSCLQIGAIPAVAGASMHLPRAGYTIKVLNAIDRAVPLSRSDVNFDELVQIPDWLNLEEVMRGDDTGVIRPSAVASGLLASFQFAQNEPGFSHEDVIAITRPPGHGSGKARWHKRSYKRCAFVCDPLHYLALIEQKSRPYVRP